MVAQDRQKPKFLLAQTLMVLHEFMGCWSSFCTDIATVISYQPLVSAVGVAFDARQLRQTTADSLTG